MPSPLRLLTLWLKSLLHTSTSSIPPQQWPLQFCLRETYRVWSIQSGIICTVWWQNLELHRCVTFSVRTLLRSRRQVSFIAINANQSTFDILSSNNSFEDFKRGKRLVEGNFVTGFVNAGEGEETWLFYLAVDDRVRGGYIGVAGEGEVGGVYFFRDCFST